MTLATERGAAGGRLGIDFFERSVHEVARDLVGCRLFYEGRGGTIVETESYERDDPACHAYVGLTPRTGGPQRLLDLGQAAGRPCPDR